MTKVDELARHVKLPPGVGAIPSCISSTSNSMKSDELKTWVLYVSLYALKDSLPKPHFNMWQAFVRACKLLLKPYISVEETNHAHELLKLFNNTFVRLIGAKYCTPNMHMQLHIKSCIVDFGPVYCFWCYSFERYNGILGGYQTNNRSISVQLMRKFSESHSIVTSYGNINQDVPSLHELKLLSKIDQNLYNIMPIYTYRAEKRLTSSMLKSNYHTFLSGGKLRCLAKEDVVSITQFLQGFFPNDEITIERIVQSYSRIKIGRDNFASVKYRANNNNDKFLLVYEENENRPGFINDIIDITVCFSNDRKISIPFFEVSIFQKHPHQDYYGVNCPMKIYNTLVENPLFAPVNSVGGKCIVIKCDKTFNRVPLAGNRLSTSFSDTVNFVIEIF